MDNIQSILNRLLGDVFWCVCVCVWAPVTYYPR